MRRLIALALLLHAMPVVAQVAAVREAELTPEDAAQIVALYNDPATSRLSGDSHIAATSELDGNVVVLEGTLTIAGRVRGTLVVINGSIIAENGARVDGPVLVIGGSIRNQAQLSADSIVWYRERLKYELRDGMLVLVHEVRADEFAAGREFEFGRTDLLFAARGGYNRTEGLPVHVGPRLMLGRRNPTLIEGLAILRTAAGFDFGTDDYGYSLTVEQFVGGKGKARVGFRVASEVLPVETWGLNDRESSLAAFVLRRDYRDHYLRTGWSAFVAGGRRGLPFDWRIEYGNHEFENTANRDPFSLRHNDDPWRPELQVPTVRLHTLRAGAGWDTRNEDRDPSTGWLARGDVEMALSLRSGDAADFSTGYRYGFLDLRRYARLTPNTRVALRAIAAGSINGEALPAFRQQSLGGDGILPGYSLYEFDCGGHDIMTDRAPYYGCDRLLFFQFEYQSKFRWLSRLGRDIGRDFGLLEHIRGVLFFNTGRTWTEPEARGFRGVGLDDFVADAGFGLRFGTFGAYWAVPLSARAQGTNFFIRLEPRI